MNQILARRFRRALLLVERGEDRQKVEVELDFLRQVHFVEWRQAGHYEVKRIQKGVVELFDGEWEVVRGDRSLLRLLVQNRLAE